MAEEKLMRLSQVARQLNVGISTITESLATKGYKVDSNPNAKITEAQFNLLLKEFESSSLDKKVANELTIGRSFHNLSAVKHEEPPVVKSEPEESFLIKNSPLPETPKESIAPSASNVETESALGKVILPGLKPLGKIDLEPKKVEKITPPQPVQVKQPEPVAPESKAEPAPAPVVVAAPEPVVEKIAPEIPKEPTIVKPASVEIPSHVEKTEAEIMDSAELVEAKADSLKGLTVLGKIQLPTEKSAKTREEENQEKKKRARIQVGAKPQPVAPIDRPHDSGFRKPGAPNTARPGKKGGKPETPKKEEPTDKEIQDKIKETLAKLGGSGAKTAQFNRAKYRREKRASNAADSAEQELLDKEQAKILKVTEFVSANDLSSMMDVSVNDVIKVCLSLGMFVSINQRLDAEAITIIADEFGYAVDFTTDEETSNEEEEAEIIGTETRAPIVTIMGHVDHGKTSLLDYIRRSNVTASEAGGITQHIGAYDVTTESGKKITFLDTPGHEAFTAMRARGAKITDVVILVVAADDNVMPQTKEAINHAQVAGVPIVIAINKVDKPGANPDKIREELSAINILVEEWGGKYQCQEVSAKKGTGIKELLEKVLLEAEILDLKANPDVNARGTVIEASLDKGRGYVTTLIVQDGTMKIGDVVVAGQHFGRVKAMFNHVGTKQKEAGPSCPVLVLGLSGAPQAGDKFKVMDSERDAREVATKRSQLMREQSIRTKKHITLDEIGRRLAIGNFKELNVIVKGDVDGSVEALSDSLLKLSTDEIKINIIHKAVGQITDSDVLLASSSDSVIIAFQVRPSASARKLAEQEQIEIRHYSIIYAAIDEIKDAMEGMLEPTKEEVIIGTIEIRQVFKISKVGTVAGCMVTDGVIKRNAGIRLVRDGIVVHTGNIDALKRFKDDAAEVKQGFECGLSIKNFNDMQEGDTIECFEIKETKRKLE
ncbi:MAG: translation initiation factor IF-2 [Cytophagales bacterium]|nr:translation initiation factor IF-2 [Cytophagales bacterium]